jgi:glycosyltransferase involved in cell wall biosynthesis
LSPRRLREIPNGVDAARFSPASWAERQALRRRLHLPEGRPVVLFVGVMMPDKQPHVLFDAWLHMRRATGIVSTLVFVGASNPQLYELADRLDERVRTAADESGYGSDVIFVAPTAAIEDYFRAADVFAMPSAREGLPIVLLEAMACGLPVVASHLPGSTDTMIEPGVNGLLVPPGDVAGFAAGLERVLTNPDEAARLGAAARKTVVDRYTIGHVAGQWLDAYQQLLTSR